MHRLGLAWFWSNIFVCISMAFPVIPRRSSTLILAVRSRLASVGYKLLMLQRSSTSKFMPNSYVFPGGISERIDFSSNWLELLGPKGLPLKTSMSNSPFYTSCTDLPVSSLPVHIGFRICAIRETFEESGVLLVKPLAGNKSDYNLSDEELNKWRQRVHNDASLFIQLCKDIQCVPDIWSLYEWCNWITPANQFRRYNTMFYFAFVDEEPEMSHDGKEMISALWIDPDEALLLSLKNKFNIGPPQFYELSRICGFTNMDDLKTFVLSVEGVEEWEPVPVLSKNGEKIINFLPADSMYEKMKMDTYKHYQQFTKTASKDLPFMQLTQTTQLLVENANRNHNRLTVKSMTNTGQSSGAECNTTLRYNMPLPLTKYTLDSAKL